MTITTISADDGIENKLSPPERQRLLAKEFLTNNCYHTLGSLTRRLGVSRTTALRDIDEFSQMLKRYGIEVVATRRKGYSVRGSEMYVRQVLADVVLSSQSESKLLSNVHEQDGSLLRTSTGLRYRRR